jgi:hypothetical protein
MNSSTITERLWRSKKKPDFKLFIAQPRHQACVNLFVTPSSTQFGGGDLNLIISYVRHSTHQSLPHSRRLIIIMRGLAFPSNAVYNREVSYDGPQQNNTPDTIPIDPALSGTAIDPAITEEECVLNEAPVGTFISCYWFDARTRLTALAQRNSLTLSVYLTTVLSRRKFPDNQPMNHNTLKVRGNILKDLRVTRSRPSHPRHIYQLWNPRQVPNLPRESADRGGEFFAGFLSYITKFVSNAEKRNVDSVREMT